jgi:hypothetical protein
MRATARDEPVSHRPDLAQSRLEPPDLLARLFAGCSREQARDHNRLMNIDAAAALDKRVHRRSSPVIGAPHTIRKDTATRPRPMYGRAKRCYLKAARIGLFHGLDGAEKTSDLG